MKNRVGYFLLLSCLWEECRFTSLNLKPTTEGENSGIWTCACVDLLPSSFLLSADHSMVRANCLIRSLCLCPIEFRVPSTHLWQSTFLTDYC